MYRKISILLTITAALLLFFTGCRVTVGGNSIQGTGAMVTRDIDVADFSMIDISGNFMIVYRQSTETALTVVMQENLFNHLETNVQGSTLRVSTRRGFDTTNANRPRLYIYAPYLTAADLSGAVSTSDWDTIQGQSFTIDASGAVSLEINLEVENLDMDISGAVSANLSGFARNINIDGSGALNIQAGDLIIESGQVDVSGAANVYLYSLENITVNTSGLARVREAS